MGGGGGGGGKEVALQALKKEGEAGILAREDVENGNLFLSFPFFSLLRRPSRSHAPRSRVPLPPFKAATQATFRELILAF